MARLLMGLLLCSAYVVHANDTAFGGTGVLPIPISNDAIAMQNEKIVIKGHDLGQGGFHGRFVYHCDFVFKNETDKVQTLQMGFPFPVSNEEEAIAYPKGVEEVVGAPLVYNFKLTVQGKPVEAMQAKILPNEQKKINYKEAYIWPMTFQPNETIDIGHLYTTGVTKDVMGLIWVEYVLKTGRLWKGGVIGQTIVEVHPNTPTRLCNELPIGDIEPAPLIAGMQIINEGKHRVYRWQLSAFSPDTDLSLCLQTGIDYVRHQILYPLLTKIEQDPKPVEQYTPTALKQLKNTVFAQYGRTFNDPSLQAYFEQQWWYEANQNYSDTLLTDEDRQILHLLAKLNPHRT